MAFNASLLRLVREAYGWPQTRLAREAGIAQGTVSKYEKGLVEPGAKQVEALANVLGFPASFFEQPDARPAAVLYRSRALRSARKEAEVRARLNLSRLIAQRLLIDIEIEREARFPSPDREYPDAETAAADVRAGWWIPPGPIDSVSDLIETAGGIVLRVDLGCDEVDAAYLHPLGDPVRWFFVNTRTTAGDRVRFSLAHELGHAVMHEVEMLPDTKEAEDESNLFSGAFHLPRQELLADLPRGRLRVGHLVELKRKWGVSMGAIAMRARQIGAITAADLTAIWKELGWRGMRMNEPVDVPVERPQILDSALRIHRRDHGLTDADLARVAHVDVATLADLFPDYFVRPRPRLAVVSSRQSGPSRRLATGA
jgi:Zn-dependent peptidase ImmA (M78 family)/DNA-binding XRE family transcriptional regulator